MQMAGLAFMLTQMINEVAEHETDWNPWVDGRPNPNFGVIRVGGQDFSLFGPSVGFFQAIANTVTGHPERAMRSLGSGTSRIFWDNFVTGFSFHGEEALITRTPTGEMKLADPESILLYMADMTIPIAPQQFAGQIAEAGRQMPGAIKQVTGQLPESERLPGPQPLERAIGGLVAAGTEVIGGRVSPISRSDWQNEVAREQYGKSYRELDASVRQTVDGIVDVQYGDRAYRGLKGYLYKERDDINKSFIQSVNDIGTKHLSSPRFTARYNPEEARKKFQKERLERSILLYGEWNKNKKRYTGGLYERLYNRDTDVDKAMPQVGTKEYNVMKYYKLFEDATDPMDGSIDWDEYERNEAQFMGSLSVEQIQQLLANIRVTEGKYPESIEKLLYAGRYAANLKVDIEGTELTYYDLEMHPIALRALTLNTGLAPEMIIAYLDRSYIQRKALQHEEPGRTIGEAIDKANRQDGILWVLRQEFTRRAPDQWLMAMLDAGYSYSGYEKINKNIREQLRRGASVPSFDYKELYTQGLMNEAA